MAILTLSREYRSGGREIGTAVAERMHYDYVGKERILADLRAQGGRWAAVLREVDEEGPTIWERFDWEYRGLMALVESTLYEFAVRDRVVLVGRGANFLLEGLPHVLRVRLTAPVEQRVEWVMQKDGVGRDSAVRLIEKTDSERASFIRVHFNREWDDPTAYDMVFDTSAKPFGEIVDILCSALQERTARLTEEGRGRLRGRTIAARIKARIATDPAIRIPTLQVSFDGRSILLRGAAHRVADLDAIERILEVTAEGTPVRNEIRYRF